MMGPPLWGAGWHAHPPLADVGMVVDGMSNYK